MWESGERPFCAGAVDQRVADHSRELRGPPGSTLGGLGRRRALGEAQLVLTVAPCRSTWERGG